MSGTHVACGDCERIRPGLIAQPANTASSLALVGVAVPIWRAAARGGLRRWQAVAVAAAVAGIGSVAYHGPGGRVGRAVHDVGVAALGATALGAMAADRREGRGPGRAAGAVAAGAVAVHATSRTRGPLCRPDSLLQGHAAWHMLIAAALLLASRRALPVRIP